MKKIIIIIGLSFLQICCNEFFQINEYYRLPEKYKTSLNESDFLIYKNENGQVDTFLVKNIVSGNLQSALSGVSSKEPYAFHEFEFIMINNLSDSFDSFRYEIMISQKDGNYGEGTKQLEISCDNLIIGIRIGTRDIENINFDKVTRDFRPLINWYGQKYFEVIQTHDSLIIGQKSYTNIVELYYDNGIKRIFYCYNEGILKYIDSEGEAWIKIN